VQKNEPEDTAVSDSSAPEAASLRRRVGRRSSPELCKKIAFRAKLNCGFCSTARGKCSRAACCENWFLHKWRHTFATNMLQSGIHIKTLQVLLGHKNLSTTEKYLRAVRLDELEQKVESSRLAAFLGHP
jgi:integrase